MPGFNSTAVRILAALCLSLSAQLWAQSAAEPRFTIWLSEDGHFLRFEGSIHYGATEHLSQVLADTPSIRHLRLNSGGGLVAEARGMVRLIGEYQLSTSVYGDCESTCALVFIAGTERMLEPDARLGFHRYHQTSPVMAMFMNSDAEQEKDMAIYRKQGVAEHFLARIIETPPNEMWFPSKAELLEAGVLTRPFHDFPTEQP